MDRALDEIPSGDMAMSTESNISTAYLRQRVHEETAAAEKATTARAAAIHVELATRYLQQLKSFCSN